MDNLINQLEDKIKSAENTNNVLTVYLKYHEAITMLSLLKGHEIYLETIKECFKIQKDLLETEVTCEMIAERIEKRNLKKILNMNKGDY